MSTSLSTDFRCPRCAAHLPAGAEWCSLCFADLRPPSTHIPSASARAEDASDPSPAVGAARGGRHARPAVTKDEVERTADALLAELAAAEGVHPLGRYAGLVDTSAKKVALMVGGTVVAMLLLFLVMAVLGALL